MKRYFNIVEAEDLKRIDLFGESWYPFKGKLIPSVTFIQSATHVNKRLAKYLQEFGEQASKDYYRKGLVGSELHRIIDLWENKDTVSFRELEPTLDNDLKIDVWERFDNFVKFYEKNLIDVEIIATEKTVFNEAIGYAGTLDLLIKKDGKYHIFDWKTSAQTYKEHKSQISAYAFACDVEIETANIICIHGANSKTKQGYSVTPLNQSEIEQYFELFIWYKKAFDREIKTPKIKSLPIKYEHDNE